MGHKGLVVAVAAAVAGLLTCGGAQAPSTALPIPIQPELWYYHHTFLSSDGAVESSLRLIDRAVAAGYTGLVLWDSSLNYLGNDNWAPENEDRMRDVLRYAAKKHLKVMASPALYGFSNEMLEPNPNWAESMRLVGTPFQVDASGTQLRLKSDLQGLQNGGFENGRTAWFDTSDQGIGLAQQAHAGASAAAVVDAPGNARFRQTFAVHPWRQYHVRFFWKSAHFRGGPMVSVFDGHTTDRTYLNATLPANGDHDWTQADYTFNSEGSLEAQIYFGVWGGCSGTILFDDVSVEETAFVYLTRRSGAPLRIYAPGHPEVQYAEGADVNPIFDPRMRDPKAFRDSYHEPPAVTLPKTTRLKPGDLVAIDSYAAEPIPGLNSVSMCMTEPATFQHIAHNVRAMHHVLPKGAGIIVGYDEIRNGNSCGSCRGQNKTAGELLAWSVGRILTIFDAEAPGNDLYTWSDMFDPYHNAHDNYYHVEGDLAGSWKGLPARVTVLNWNLDRLHDSLSWFAGTDSKQPVAHRQVIAGYYDSGDGAKSAAQEMAAAAGVPGVQGAMYTTWNDDYGQLREFADTVRAGWGQYRASVGGH